MQRFIDFSKNVVYTLTGVVWLLISVYANALFFLLAMFTDKLFKLLGTTLTVDAILRELEYAFQTRYDEYRHSLANFQLKNIKFPF